MFTVAQFITSQKLKQPKYPSTDEWINKIWYIHIMDYHLAVKRNEALRIYATIRTKLEYLC